MYKCFPLQLYTDCCMAHGTGACFLGREDGVTGTSKAVQQSWNTRKVTEWIVPTTILHQNKVQYKRLWLWGAEQSRNQRMMRFKRGFLLRDLAIFSLGGECIIIRWGTNELLRTHTVKPLSITLTQEIHTSVLHMW